MKLMKQILIVPTLLIHFSLYAKGDEKISGQDRTVANHSLTLNFLGLNYNYEQPVSRKATLVFSTGLSYTFGRLIGIGMDADGGLMLVHKDYHLLTGVLSVEPRYYYNLYKRHRKEKRTFGNSGAYLSAELAYLFPMTISGGIHAAQLMSVTPYWGFRRVWRHFAWKKSPRKVIPAFCRHLWAGLIGRAVFCRV